MGNALVEFALKVVKEARKVGAIVVLENPQTSWMWELPELKAKRRAERLPDATFDIDGDGVVGPTDYFVAKTFAKEQRNRLDTGDRGKVVEALEQGFLDRYSWGYDEVGAARKNVVKQLRGRIYNGDNGHELSHVYPPHWNSDKIPNYWTELKILDGAGALSWRCEGAVAVVDYCTSVSFVGGELWMWVGAGPVATCLLTAVSDFDARNWKQSYGAILSNTPVLDSKFLEPVRLLNECTSKFSDHRMF
ncbi:unnamed protein product [Symbiodinium natans]|uniref:Uncharacterized protein n=1 Tax=Symbiodinium natans TaxID=878477 RepID=A0A812PDR8_9DINO|nr:unnamed protein product [Symbiodinium natans]